MKIKAKPARKAHISSAVPSHKKVVQFENVHKAEHIDSAEIVKERNRTATRNAYRKSKKDFELVGCLRSLSFFEDHAEHGPVEHVAHVGQPFSVPFYKVTVVADLLQMSYQSLWRLVTAQLVPSPVLIFRIGKRELPVYHREEVRHILTVIGEHKRAFAYYRQGHTATKDRLYENLDAIRQEWETTKPWQPPSAKPPARRPLASPSPANPQRSKPKRKSSK